MYWVEKRPHGGRDVNNGRLLTVVRVKCDQKEENVAEWVAPEKYTERNTGRWIVRVE